MKAGECNSQSKGSSGPVGPDRARQGSHWGAGPHSRQVKSPARHGEPEAKPFEMIPNRVFKAAQPLTGKATTEVFTQDTVTLEGHFAEGKLRS